MNDTLQPSPAPTAPPAHDGSGGRGERLAWWIAFGGLTLALVLMLGLWN